MILVNVGEICVIFFEFFDYGAGKVLISNDGFGFKGLGGIGDSLVNKYFGGAGWNTKSFGVDAEGFLEFGGIEWF